MCSIAVMSSIEVKIAVSKNARETLVSRFSSVGLYQNTTFSLTSLLSSPSINRQIWLLPALLRSLLYCRLVYAFASFNRRGGTRQPGITRYVYTPKVPLLSGAPHPISESRCAATPVEAALYWSDSLLAQHIMPQLARELSLAAAIRCFRITSRRNSRDNCSILGTLPACELNHAVTRVESTSSTPGTPNSSSTPSSSGTPCWFAIHCTTSYFQITSRRSSRGKYSVLVRYLLSTLHSPLSTSR
jgi:hypothetical protein